MAVGSGGCRAALASRQPTAEPTVAAGVTQVSSEELLSSSAASDECVGRLGTNRL